jgi:hypothetical protein
MDLSVALYEEHLQVTRTNAKRMTLWWATRKRVLATVKKDGTLLEWASPEHRDDRAIVLAAVKDDGWALQWASERLQVTACVS